jgi:hypothetical protein
MIDSVDFISNLILKGNKNKKSKKFSKGKKSLTRKNRKDFITHMGDKYFNRKSKREKRNEKGTKKKPYSRKK